MCLYKNLMLINRKKCPECNIPFNQVYRTSKLGKHVYLGYCKKCNITYQHLPILDELIKFKDGKY